MIEPVIDPFLRIALMAAPLYIANSTGLVFGFGKAIDGGRNFFDGRPLLGMGKTVQGTFAALAAGFALTWIVYLVFAKELNLLFPGPYLLYGMLLSLGAVAGDAAASFFKRRIGLKRGHSVLFLDQLDFVVGGILVGMIAYVPSILEVGLLLVITLSIHRFGNFLAFKLKMKKVPW